MKRRNCIVALILLVVSTALPAGCGETSSLAQGEDRLQGKITVSGAWALYPLMVRWGEEFQKINPGVKFDISAGGAGKGVVDALAGAVDIGMVSREVYPEEIAKGAFWVAVTRDAVFLTVNEMNPVWEDLHLVGVSREVLIDIYITGKIVHWGQVVDRSDVRDVVHVYTRSDSAGAPATWAAYLGHKQEDLLGVGVYGDPGVLEAVIKDPLGVGFNNLNYAFDFQTGLPVVGARVVPIDVNGNGHVDAEEVYDTKKQAIQAVTAGRYPSPPARDLNLVTKGKPEGLVRIFIRWVLTDGQKYVDEVGYVTFTEEQLDDALQRLE